MFEVSMKPGPDALRRALVTQHQARWKAAMARMNHEAAKILMSALLENAPAQLGEDFQRYRKSFQVVSAAKGSTSFGVAASGFSAMKPTAEHLVTFSQEGQPTLTPTEKLLIEHSPWPSEMVPKLTHRLKQEKTQAAGDTIMTARKRISAEWTSIRDTFRVAKVEMSETPPTPRTEDLDRALMTSVLQHEFGVSAPHAPHWRPALERVKQQLPHVWKRMERILLDPNYTGWSQIPAEEPLSRDDLALAGEFAKRLGVHSAPRK